MLKNNWNIRQQTISKLTVLESIVFTVPLSDIEALGEEPSSDPSLTGDTGCMGGT